MTKTKTKTPEPQLTSYWALKEHFKATENEGLIFYGCGGDLNDWVSGISERLIEENIIKETPDAWHTFVTSGGRIDLVMEFPKDIDVGRLAIWRLNFGDCGWWSDYIVNYEHQHTGADHE
jgi:hypothetical protein